jgi:hypothetical protein
MRPSIRLALGWSLAIAIAVPLFAVVAPSAMGHSIAGKYLEYGNCCNGETLDGTHAYVTPWSISPDTYDCIIVSSLVQSQDSARQLEVGDAKCGLGSGIDNTCSESGNLVTFVERTPAVGTPVCYQHAAPTIGSPNHFGVVDLVGLGTYYAYIDGAQREGQSGYDADNRIYEWAEYSAGTSCSGWSADADFTTWQRYYVSVGTWKTVQSAYGYTYGAVCWLVSGLSSGNFNVSH